MREISRGLRHARHDGRLIGSRDREELGMERVFWNAPRRACLLIALLSSGSVAAPPAGAPRADGPVLVPPGSSWVTSVRTTGSFGAGERQSTTRARGERIWSARKVYAHEGERFTLLIDPGTGRWVARLQGTILVERFDPPIGFDWPIWVGKSWSQKFRYTNSRGQSSAVQGWFRVEAFEEIQVRAGTFQTFRSSYSDGSIEMTYWWSPLLGLIVKSQMRRTESHAAGPGTQETELVSHNLKR
jgi:hypothetical protein